MATSGAREMECSVYGVIANIPPQYHSSDLRNYFSQFIESGGFECFHFRHRPEKRIPSKSAVSEGPSQVWSQTTDASGGKTSLCCVVKLKASKLEKLIHMYHGKHWLDKKGESIRNLCLITAVKLDQINEKEYHVDDASKEYKTRRELKYPSSERVTFTPDDLRQLKELHPPDMMPNGNVGTPTKVFLDLIRACRLPAAVIKKLGLTFPKTRSKHKYGDVPYEYDGELYEGMSEWELVTSGSGHDLESGVVSSGPRENIPSESEVYKDNHSGAKTLEADIIETNKEFKKRKQKTESKEALKNLDIEGANRQGSESEEDADDCEEWERHEALHDDAANVERNKERLFEEDLEVQWEKGGSGLVFYTDAQYWDQQEGDFDEKTADDWDVDMSIYYDSNGGDMDARDFITMRQEQRRRKGEEDTDRFTAGIGKFEKHTKGIGRKVLEKQGWKEGQGLGTWIEGMTEALDNEGQKPYDRTGFGYRGEKLKRFQAVGSKRPRVDRPILISTVYDDPKMTDPQEPLLRRSEPHTITYRPGVKFTKASDDKDS